MSMWASLFKRFRRNSVASGSPSNSDALTIKSSLIDKSGSFARHDFKKGELIRHLTGDVVTHREIVRRIKRGKLSSDDPLQIGDDKYIDLDASSLAINHSCDPNSGVRDCNQLIAIRDIQAGEEVTFDYSTTVTTKIEAFSWSMSCNCGNSNCRARIGNVSTVPKQSLMRLFEMNALPRYIVEELGLETAAPQSSSQSTQK